MCRVTKNPRYGVISFRVGMDEMNLIKKTATDLGKTRGELARELVMDAINARSETNGK